MNITLGKIVGVFGIKGWVKVFSETRPREQIFSYSPWLLEVNGRTVEVELLDGRQQLNTKKSGQAITPDRFL